MIATIQSIQSDTAQVYYSLCGNWRLEKLQERIEIILDTDWLGKV